MLIILFTITVVAIHSQTTHKATIVQKPTPTPTPTPTSTPTNPSFQDFVKVCGLQLCLNDKPWKPYFASTYAASHHLEWDTTTAVQGHLNTIRINNFLNTNSNPLTAPYDEAHWKIVDQLIASARSKGLHVLLDLSSYRNLTTQRDTQNAYLVDWKPFLTFVIHRVNTVTNVQYGSDTTIALFALAGEVAPPNGTNTVHVTTQQITTFFARTALEFKALDQHHLLSPGGLYQLDWNSGINYQTIFSTPGMDVCAVHAPPNGSDAPLTAQFCASIHKPWIWEEFFQPQGIGDQARAIFYQQAYTEGAQLHTAGIGFWNLGPGLGATNDDVGPQTPLTWQIVINNTPSP
ncbi:MAG TPA: hypothetical protein VIY29_29840 [Ktedonobacteraceae bacterium]